MFGCLYTFWKLSTIALRWKQSKAERIKNKSTLKIDPLATDTHEHVWFEVGT